MEYLDILDENGELTGQKKSRADAHRDGDWHKAVHVWIVNSKQEFLLQKRSETKESNPGMWDISFAGHVSAGYSSLETVVREAKEELGLEVTIDEVDKLFDIKAQSVHKNGTYINNEFNEVYLISKDIKIAEISIQVEELAEVRWISFLELEEKVRLKDQSIVVREEEYGRLFEILHQRFNN